MLEEEQSDEDGKEEGDGEVLIKRPHSRAVKGKRRHQRLDGEDPRTDALAQQIQKVCDHSRREGNVG